MIPLPSSIPLIMKREETRTTIGPPRFLWEGLYREPRAGPDMVRGPAGRKLSRLVPWGPGNGCESFALGHDIQVNHAHGGKIQVVNRPGFTQINAGKIGSCSFGRHPPAPPYRCPPDNRAGLWGCRRRIAGTYASGSAGYGRKGNNGDIFAPRPPAEIPIGIPEPGPGN